MYPPLFESLALLGLCIHRLGSTHPLCSLLHCVVWPRAAGFTISVQEKATERERERKGRHEKHEGTAWTQRRKRVCVFASFFFFFKLTKTSIVLEEVQKFRALFHIIPTVAAVTPRGHAEATGVYVVGRHDCTWKSKNKHLVLMWSYRLFCSLKRNKCSSDGGCTVDNYKRCVCWVGNYVKQCIFSAIYLERIK